MKSVFFLIIVVAISLFGLINYYIGLRGWQTIGSSILFLIANIFEQKNKALL